MEYQLQLSRGIHTMGGVHLKTRSPWCSESQNYEEIGRVANLGWRSAIFSTIILVADKLMIQIHLPQFFVMYTMSTVYMGAVIILSIDSLGESTPCFS